MRRTPSTKVPASTYRFQLHAGFTLDDAAERLPYLRALGVDWVYLSPMLPSEPGSNHGYDVVAHDTVDEARGGPEALTRFSTRAHALGFGVLADVVPNHVGVATPRLNAWWWDLLAAGQDSRYAEAFDVDWTSGDGQLLIPVVGDDDESSVSVDVDAGVVRYHDHEFPLAVGTTSLAEQHYRLVSWRAADSALNYRRFFAINTLAAVRVEVPWVFEETHREIGRWVREGLVDGLRVDHPDGLRDPAGYLDDLATLTDGAYVLVEKILEPGESLVGSWATAGTTGYDALGLIDRVLTDPSGAGALPFADLEWAAMIHDTKRAVADGILGSEARRIVRELPELSVPEAELLDAVSELLAGFGVYRSYLPAGVEHALAAFESARAWRPELAAALDELQPVLTSASQPAALRFQQTSGMVMAKGVEDCAFYRYPRLTSLTEVGGDPSEFSLSVDGFHEAMATRQAEWPTAMTCTSTHDTKRGEDVRARIDVLAEVPALWTASFARLQELAPVPDEAFADLLWQAIVGAWADDADLRPRLHAYAEKAMREAGSVTTWTAIDEAFEATVHAAVDSAFDDPAVREVLRELLEVVTVPGFANALSAKLIALTMPGVPDVYQGSELWEQSLVDPDNRRPVDYDLRERLLALGSGGHPAAAKLHLVKTALGLRRERTELFTGYAPVAARGGAASHVVAFDRGGVIAVASRLPVGLMARGGWADTKLSLPPGQWRDLLSGAPASAYVGDLLATHPVALLVQDA